MPYPTKYQLASGSNQSEPQSQHESPDELVEYLHELDVCAEEDFWWDEEDRHEL